MADSLDRYEWSPPAPPLSIGEIQRGIAPIFCVRNERASDPFDGEFEHWSALPALSYFALNAVTLRESLRRVAPPTTFRPPPRLTLSDQRRQSWLEGLRNPSVPLRTLSRAIPHGYTSSNLLAMLVQNEIPVFRAVWFIKCVGANEVRALKRKTASSGLPSLSEPKRIEVAWLSEWTHAVITTVSQVVESFGTIESETNNQDIPTNVDYAERGGGTRSQDTNEELLEQADVKDSWQDAMVDEKVESGRHSTVVDLTSPAGSDHEHDDSIDELFGDDNEESDKNNRNTGNESSEEMSETRPVNNTEKQSVEREGSVSVSLEDKCQSVAMWQKRMEYISRLTLSLYHASLLNRHEFLDWLIEQLKYCKVELLPCFVHFVQLLWKPMTSSAIAPRFLRAIAHRYRSLSGSVSPAYANIVTLYFEPLVFKLMSTDENAFVAPRTWPIIEPHVRSHPAYSRIAERNQAFMPRDPHDPSDWSQPLTIGSLLDNFARPYKLDDLLHSLKSLDVDLEVLVRTILLRTLRQGTPGSISLCIVLLKHFVSAGSTNRRALVSEFCVDFLLDPHLVYGSKCLGALISELVRAKLCSLDIYISKLIAQDILHGPGASESDDDTSQPAAAHGTNMRELHLRLLQDLPFDWLPPNLLTQVYTMLWRAGASLPSTDLDSFVKEGAQILKGKQSPTLFDRLRSLPVNDRHRLADRLTSMFEELSKSQDTMVADPAVFARFTELMDIVGVGSIRPLYKILIYTVSSPHAQNAIIGSALRQVHIRLMAFVCSGLVDSFVRRLLGKLAECVGAYNASTSRNQAVFQWVSWDDVCALRAVIQSPDTMCELNAIIPLRQMPVQYTLTSGHTPIEKDVVIRGALYKPGSPDIGTLLNMRGEESLAHDIVEWTRSSCMDRTALLQLLTYHAVEMSEVVDASSDKFGLLRFLLLAPSNELGFCFEEVEALRIIRFNYLSSLSSDQILKLATSVPAIEFASRIAHEYPELYINRIVIPSLDNATYFEALKNGASAEMKRFEVLFLRCTPFNLRFYQGLVLLTFRDRDAESVANEVLRAAYAHPETSPALQGLLQYLDEEAKTLIFTKTVDQFLANGLDTVQLSKVNTHYTLVGALASSMTSNVKWSVDGVPEFLDNLVRAAEQPTIDRRTLRKMLILVLRICVVARLHNVELPTSAVPYLEMLLHVQAFADNHRMRTIIEDALRLLLRIARKTHDDRHDIVVNDDDQGLNAGPSATDGLRVYSKANDRYDPLPVWAFDLIEDANPVIGKNDSAIDLSLFEAYED